MTETTIWNSETQAFESLETSERSGAIKEIRARLKESSVSAPVAAERERSRLRWATAR